MMKVIIGIYLFGLALETYRVYGERKLYIKYYNKMEILIDILWVFLWPVRWLGNFINYYLHGPKDFMK